MLYNCKTKKQLLQVFINVSKKKQVFAQTILNMIGATQRSTQKVKVVGFVNSTKFPVNLQSRILILLIGFKTGIKLMMEF